MRRAAPPEFYDARLGEPGTALLLDPAASPYRELWRAAIYLIPPGSSVVELGSGTGRFAGLLADRGQRSYVGLDFAPGHVEEARRYRPDLDFRLADLRTDPIPRADVYVALEVLEHLNDDLGLLARLPRRSRVVLSVPSFDSASHVRTFPRRGAAAARYAGLLLLDTTDYIPHRRGTYFHLLRGART